MSLALSQAFPLVGRLWILLGWGGGGGARWCSESQNFASQRTMRLSELVILRNCDGQASARPTSGEQAEQPKADTLKSLLSHVHIPYSFKACLSGIAGKVPKRNREIQESSQKTMKVLRKTTKRLKKPLKKQRRISCNDVLIGAVA